MRRHQGLRQGLGSRMAVVRRDIELDFLAREEPQHQPSGLHLLSAVAAEGTVTGAPRVHVLRQGERIVLGAAGLDEQDRKSTRLNSSHVKISYAVFCLKKKKKREQFIDMI